VFIINELPRYKRKGPFTLRTLTDVDEL